MSQVLYILHPYLADKSTGRGHDRYAYELLRHVGDFGVDTASIDSGMIETMVSGAAREFAFPFRLWSKRSRVYHATASVNARVPVWLRKRPLVTTVHDVIWYHTGSRYDAGVKNLYKQYCIGLAARSSDRVIVPFPSTREFLIEKIGVAPERIRLVPYGLDHEQFYPAPEHRSGKDLDVNKAELNVVFIGQLTKAKGVDSLIRAFSQVHRAIPKARLQICSGGWHESYVHEVWSQSEAKDHIVLRGHIPEDALRDTYANADITVFPSRYGFGLPTIESMACGTPTIAGRSLDATDFVGDEALLVDPNDVDALAEQMVRLLSDAALYRQLSQKGLHKAASFSWREMARHTAAVYEELL